MSEREREGERDRERESDREKKERQTEREREANLFTLLNGNKVLKNRIFQLDVSIKFSDCFQHVFTCGSMKQRVRERKREREEEGERGREVRDAEG